MRLGKRDMKWRLTSAASKSFLKGVPALTLTVHADILEFRPVLKGREGRGCIRRVAARRSTRPRATLTLSLEIDHEIDLRLHILLWLLLLSFCHVVGTEWVGDGGCGDGGEGGGGTRSGRASRRRKRRLYWALRTLRASAAEACDWRRAGPLGR